MGTFAFMPLGVVLGLLYHEHLWRQAVRAGRGEAGSVFYTFWTRYLMLAAVLLLAAKAGGGSLYFLLPGVLMGRPFYLLLFGRTRLCPDREGEP
ncbi:MAG TPA: hypothetical protein ENJ04_07925 [Nitrospirae bacterium]|nr:hypothetical protein [Nitrospirota bacterium]